MNLPIVLLFSVIVSVEIYGAHDPAPVCDIKPSNVNKVDVVVYINGETLVDIVWYREYCSARDDGMPYDKYAPVTVKVGVGVTCDKNNKCVCPDLFDSQGACQTTFEHVCAEKILGQEKFKNLLCCTMLEINGKRKGFKKCVDEQLGLAENINTCMKTQGPESPQEIATCNSNEIIHKGVDITQDTEPIYFYNGVIQVYGTVCHVIETRLLRLYQQGSVWS